MVQDEFSERFQTAVDHHPHPHPSEWSLSLEIMCMHFILSGPRTSLHIFDGGRGGGGGRRPSKENSSD